MAFNPGWEAIARDKGLLDAVGVPETTKVPPKPVRTRLKRSSRKFVIGVFESPGTWTLPIHTVSEANRSNREPWIVKSKRGQEQERIVAIYLKARIEAVCRFTKMIRDGQAIRVTMTRIAPRLLDEGDNLSSALKRIRDQIAKLLLTDDGPENKLVKWVYGQERSNAYGIRIELTRKDEPT